MVYIISMVFIIIEILIIFFGVYALMSHINEAIRKIARYKTQLEARKKQRREKLRADAAKQDSKPAESAPAPSAPAQKSAESPDENNVSTPENASVQTLLSMIEREHREGSKDREAAVAALEKRLAKALLNESTLYGIYDAEIPGNGRIWVEIDGRVMLFTNRGAAANTVSIYAGQNMRLCIAELKGKQIADYLAAALEMGICLVRVDKGVYESYPEFNILDIIQPAGRELAAWAGINLRNFALRSRVCSTAMSKSMPEIGSRGYRALMFWLTTARLNTYSNLGNGIFYVLKIREGRADGITWCTEQAVQKATELLNDKAYSSCTIYADCDTEHRIYDGPRSMYVMNTPGGSRAVKDGCVCVFTSLARAKKACAMFAASGNNDVLPVLATYTELMEQARQCAGILIDVSDIGEVIAKDWYEELEKYSKTDGLIYPQLNFDA